MIYDLWVFLDKGNGRKMGLGLYFNNGGTNNTSNIDNS